jgi:hypothetical protein
MAEFYPRDDERPDALDMIDLEVSLITPKEIERRLQETLRNAQEGELNG